MVIVAIQEIPKTQSQSLDITFFLLGISSSNVVDNNK